MSKSGSSSTASASPSTISDLTQASAAPVKLPGQDLDELIKFRESPEGKKLAAWAKSAFNDARDARTSHQHQWYINLLMVFGNQYLTSVQTAGNEKRLLPQKTPSYVRRKQINRLQAFVRTECSKFQSTFPSLIVVPSTSEEEDIRAAYASEQAWQSMQETKKLRRIWARATWWMVITGNGFLKQWWDPSCEVPGKEPGKISKGDIKFESVSPFHFFVADTFEREIDDQAYVIQAQTKTADWARAYYADELKGVKLAEGSANGSAGNLDNAFREVIGGTDPKKDKVTVYEYWVKKGATELLPDGGLVIMIDDTIVSYSATFPYKHGQYPFSKIEHISTDTFYAISPVNSLIDLQKEFNEIRTDIAMAGKRMARPQLLATKGSIVVSRMTNEPGSVIEVEPGYALPTPIPLSQLPQYYTEQQDRILADFEDISGQHEVSKGQAPQGVTAGTALSFLKETDDAYLTPQYQNIEEGVERTATQSLSLFNQYVDIERKLQVVGKDGSFDVLMMQGSDIASGLDVRVERGSSIGESQAAKQARLLEYFQNGIIDQGTILRLLELGGPQKLLDTMNVAARKAQRENLKMKAIDEVSLQQQQQEFVQQQVQQLAQNPAMMEQLVAEGHTSESIIQAIQQGAPPMVPVDDFDLHEVHLEEHNRYRMSQEYETLPDPIKQEFQKHCASHEQFLQQAMAMQMMMQNMGGAQPPGGPGGQPGGQTPGPQAMPDSMSPEQPQA